MEGVGVMLAEVCCLQVKEVTEVLDCLWQGVTLRHGEDGIEEVIHIGLENTLLVRWGRHKRKGRKAEGDRRVGREGGEGGRVSD